MPSWPAAVPEAHDGESLSDAILRLRGEISSAGGELMRLKTAPLPAAELRSLVEAEVDRLAKTGRPYVVTEAGGKPSIIWPDQMRFAVPGSVLSAPSGSASQLLAALFPAELKRLLCDGIEDSKHSVPSAERPRPIRETEARIFAAEIAEERLVMAALDSGLEVDRRLDASPWAVLNAGTAEAVREAAE